MWAACEFMDPIADIAVFGSPDSQELYEQAQAYDTLTEQAAPFPIGKLRFSRSASRSIGRITIDGVAKEIDLGPRETSSKASSGARILSLEGEWFLCRVTSLGRSLWIDEMARPIVGGMSGSPIILPDGAAVGMVCVSANISPAGPNPMLAANLPGWLLDEAAASEAGGRRP